MLFLVSLVYIPSILKLHSPELIKELKSRCECCSVVNIFIFDLFFAWQAKLPKLASSDKTNGSNGIEKNGVNEK